MAKEGKWLRIDNPIMWAVLATAIFGGLLVYLGSVPTCNKDLFPAGQCPAKWRHIVSAPINEVGDTLAGLAGVLAFIWLVATVLLQAHELREQRKELELTREEFSKMAAAQEKQVLAMEEQVAVYKLERRLTEQNEATNKFEQLLLEFQERLTTSKLTWSAKPDVLGGVDQIKLSDFDAKKYLTISQEQFFRNLLENISYAERHLSQEVEKRRYESLPNRDAIDGPLETLQELLELRHSLSEATQVRARRMNLDRILLLLSSLAAQAIWSREK